jgi:nicotinamide-nucleotide amidase
MQRLPVLRADRARLAGVFCGMSPKSRCKPTAYTLTASASGLTSIAFSTKRSPVANDAELRTLAARVGASLADAELRLVTAESCTGGWIAKALTDVPGSSAWFLGGVVAYSNVLKQALLGVRPSTLASHGAVSEATAREMAVGALETLGGQIALAVTGIAGPDGGQPGKPVGTVWFAWAWRHDDEIDTRVACEVFSGDRDAVRRQTVERALRELLSLHPEGL